MSSVAEEAPNLSPDILVVDDDPKNLLAMEVALGSLSNRMIKVTSGEDALMRLLDGEFAVILLDIQMPNMDGFEAARLIRSRKKTRQTPIIFVTAFNHDPSDLRRGYELGAVDYLFKPIVPEILRAKVSVFVELRDRNRQVAELERREAARRFEEERRRWEEEALRRKNEQLAEMDRRKDEFIAVLAHELRNPLTPIVSGIELLRGGKLTEEMSDRVRELMDRQIRHMVRLIDDLLDISRISQGKIRLHRKPIDLRDAVDHAVEACQASFDRRKHTLVVDRAEAPIPVFGDLTRLTQVVSNLLTNSARYTEPGGRVLVHCEVDESWATVRVVDNGRGISPEHVDRIFDMFVQEREGGPGLGLGLTLVRTLVEMHDGEVFAKSEGEGQGCEFTVKLPLTDSVDAEASAARAGASEEPDRPLRIVLVEDDDDIRTTVRMMLEDWGHQVFVAESGPVGVESVLRQKPDVAILDLSLPGLDGFAVARRIKEELGDQAPQLIAISGLAGPQDQMKTRESGFDLHLSKPADPASLRRLLQALK